MSYRAILLIIACLSAITVPAKRKASLPPLHIEGRWLTDTGGNHVILHGVMDTPSMYFNNYRWGSPWSIPATYYDDNGAARCKAYFSKLFAGLQKARCDVFRLHMDPAWTNDPSDTYIYPGSAGQTEDTKGEADIRKFNPERLKHFLHTLYFPLAKEAMNHGMYVSVNMPDR